MLRMLTGFTLGVTLTIACRRYGPALLWWIFTADVRSTR